MSTGKLHVIIKKFDQLKMHGYGYLYHSACLQKVKSSCFNGKYSRLLDGRLMLYTCIWKVLAESYEWETCCDKHLTTQCHSDSLSGASYREFLLEWLVVLEHSMGNCQYNIMGCRPTERCSCSSAVGSSSA